jgi:hypothetical protein
MVFQYSLDIEERFLGMVIRAASLGESATVSLPFIKTVYSGTAEPHGATDGYVNVK